MQEGQLDLYHISDVEPQCYQEEQQSPVSVQSLKYCGVCGDNNVRWHYGAFTCNGCRSFFRRTVRLRIEHFCVRVTSKCYVDKNAKRHSCKKCRFEKCLSIGMNPKAVQNPRDTIFKTGPKTKEEWQAVEASTGQCSSTKLTTVDQSINKSINNQSDNSFIAQSPPNVKLTLKEQKLLSSKLLFYTSNNNCSNENVQQTLQMALSFDCQFKQGYALSIQRHIGQLNQPSREVARFNGCLLLSKDITATMIKLQSYEMVFVARQLDCFTALPLHDQMSLLRAFAGVSVVFDLAQRKQMYRDILLFEAGEQRMLAFSATPRSVQLLLDNVLPALPVVDPDETEFALLKFIAFLNPDICSLESREIVRGKRSLCFVALEHYIFNNKSLSGLGRMGSLLMLTKSLEWDYPECQSTV